MLNVCLKLTNSPHVSLCVTCLNAPARIWLLYYIHTLNAVSLPIACRKALQITLSMKALFLLILKTYLHIFCGADSSVGIVTDYGNRIMVGWDFPPVQTGPGAHPASWTMGTGSSPGVKSSRGVLLTTHPLLVPSSWKSRAIPLPTLWATTGPITGTLLYLTVMIVMQLMFLKL